MNRSVFVLNSSHPELDHLSAELSRRGLLQSYVRRYTMRNRGWERLLRQVPRASAFFAESSRRRIIEGLNPTDVIEAGVACDLLAAASAKLPLGQFSRPLKGRFLKLRDQAIVRLGTRLVAHASVAVANYTVALDLFKAVKTYGGQTILSYPTAHHAYFKAMMEEEAAREPAFADSLIGQAPAVSFAKMDEECALANRILVGSSFALATFLSQGIPPEKLKVVTYGTDVATQFTPAESEQKSDIFRILFVGQLTQRKGISYLLRAYERIKGPGTELVLTGRIVGSADAYTPYRHLFRHIGQVAHSELPELFRSAAVFVLPTLIEGMPLVVLEAMACGIPVIVSPNGPGDIVRDGIDGFVVPVRDVNGIAEKLEMLRADPERRRQMGLSARQRALEFSWARYETQAADLVSELIAPDSRIPVQEPVEA
jgi:glycosyltransferase involved in cell wall biosynthesis